MLSYKAFCAKHEAKYRGLTDEQRRSRYDDYRASFLANSNGGGSGSVVPYAPKSVPSRNVAQRVRNDLALAASQTAPRMNSRSPAVRSQAPQVKMMSSFNRMAENIAATKYIEQLLDPMANHDGKQPSFVPYPSTSFQVKETFLVKTRSDGEFCFLIRDDIDRFRADTWTVRDTSLPMSAKTTAIQASVTESTASTANPLFGFNLTEQFPLATSGDYQSRWTSCAEAQTLKTSFSSFRTVSLGLEVNYVEAPVDASGTICATLWHPSVSLPVTGGDTDTPDWSGAINFEDILDLEQSQSFPAIGGCSLNWRPFGESITELRPTYMMDPDRIGDLDSDLVYLTASAPTSDADKLLAFMAEDGANNEVRLRDGWDNVLDAGSPLLMVSGAGLVGDKEPLRVTVCWTVEAVADERTFSLVQSNHNVHVPGAVNKVASVLSDTPASHAGTSKTDGGGMPPSVSHMKDIATKVGDGVDQVTGAESTGQKIAAGVKTAVDVASIIASFF
jgi:hypothetical protein